VQCYGFAEVGGDFIQGLPLRDDANFGRNRYDVRCELGDGRLMATVALDIGTLVVSSPDTLGGRPHITGTRLSVQRVAAWYKMGLNAEEICDRIGTVNLAQIYAALAYYHGNRDEIERYLAEEKAEYERLSAQVRSTPEGKLA
jgi:uncharacterized protein (DUF433 family)